MVNTDQIIEVIPHYVAMLVVMFIVLGIVQATYGATSFWIDVVIIVAVVFGYQIVVQRLGYAPSSWQKR